MKQIFFIIVAVLIAIIPYGYVIFTIYNALEYELKNYYDFDNVEDIEENRGLAASSFDFSNIVDYSFSLKNIDEA